MHAWRDLLVDFSTPILKSESLAATDVKPFDDDRGIINNAVGILDRLDAIYSTMEGPKPAAIGFVIAIFFLLLFPYLLQSRHSKSIYRLLGKRQSLGGMSFSPEPAPQQSAPQPTEINADIAPEPETPSKPNADNDFEMFKL